MNPDTTKERDRVWRILVDEIRGNLVSKKNIEQEPNLPADIKSRELFGFDCQVSALAVLGSKLFGTSRDDLIRFAAGETMDEGGTGMVE